MTGERIALAICPDGAHAALAFGDHGHGIVVPFEELAVRDSDSPRWIVWNPATAQALVRSGVRLSRCWDLAAVHRLLVGGWRAEPPRAWAIAKQLPAAGILQGGPFDLFNQATSTMEPVAASGYLDPGWVADSNKRALQWAALAFEAATAQEAQLAGPVALSTAHAESTAELLCSELAADGLPIDIAIAQSIIAQSIGPRPAHEAEAAAERARRDAEVLRHTPPGVTADLRSPVQVRRMLQTLGFDLPDTRAWRLEALRAAHPLIDALLTWRKAERLVTTYGYSWLDQHVGPDGRLRGDWTACDGAAGRMTASGALHSMPAELRPAIVAEPDYLFVRADLGQIEPRILAAVSGDQALARATHEADMYLPVAAALDVDRATAKVAVLGAMYGQTTGHGATALKRLHAAYPVAMRYLDDADRAGQEGRDLRTYGGRLIRLGRTPEEDEMPARDARSRAAARGRYARNALVQGAAAEFFKRWAAIVRAGAHRYDARIVLCLHDELLVHAPVDTAADVAALLDESLARTARGWAAQMGVRFVADISTIERWSDAK